QRLARTPGRTENAGLKMAFGLQRRLWAVVRCLRALHEEICSIALDLLGGVLRVSVQHHPTRFRHDYSGSGCGARRSALPLFRGARLRDLPRLWTGHGCWGLSCHFRDCAPVPRRPVDRMEERLAAASTLDHVLQTPTLPSPASGGGIKGGGSLRKRTCSNKNIERDADSKKNHPALRATM